VASGILPVLAAGFQPPERRTHERKLRWNWLAPDGRKIFPAGLEAGLYGRQDACRYWCSAIFSRRFAEIVRIVSTASVAFFTASQ
jgi:hypothetical protein